MDEFSENCVEENSLGLGRGAEVYAMWKTAGRGALLSCSMWESGLQPPGALAAPNIPPL